MTDLVTTLPDLADMPLADLLALASDHPALAAVLRRVLDEDEASTPIAGFQSAI